MYYQNGEVTGTVNRLDNKYPTDKSSNMTIGKPNHGLRNFGKFLMNDLLIYYRVLEKQEIEYLNGKGKCILYQHIKLKK